METNQATATDEELDIKYVQSKRKFIVENMMEKGIPKDRSEQAMLLAALDGLDRSAISRLRIKAEDKNANNMLGAAGIIAQMLTKVNPQTNQIFDMAPPSLPASIAPIELLPGETDIGTMTISCDEIMANKEIL